MHLDEYAQRILNRSNLGLSGEFISVLNLLMRNTFWGGCEQKSFEEYVRSTTNLPSCNVVVTAVRHCNEQKLGKDVCLERMFQKGRETSAAFVYNHHARVVSKKNRLVAYKFSQGREYQLEQKRRNKTPEDFVVKSRRLITRSLNKQLQLDIPSTANSTSPGQWRKIMQVVNTKVTSSQLVVNAEAVVWEEKKTSSLSDAAYCKIDKYKPNVINQIVRFRQKKERQEERYRDRDEKRQDKGYEKRTSSPVKRTESPCLSPKSPIRDKRQSFQTKIKLRARAADLMKVDSHTKMEYLSDNAEPEEMEETICFLKDPQQIDLSSQLFSDFEAKDSIAGQAFSMVQVESGRTQLLFEYQAYTRMQVASLTKTMTCLLVLLLVDKLRIDSDNTYIKVNEKASKLMGTTAGLLYSDHVKLADLLYGLMLPSGNDAALALAEWAGTAIRNYCFRRNSNSVTSNSKHRSLLRVSLARRTPIGLFVFHMNSLARCLGMDNTKFANVHGLMNKRNYSCSRDQVKLCLFAMKRSDFRRIVNCKQYRCTIPNKMFANERDVVWQNTNRLLETEGFCGVKTGITPTAGPCLASCYQLNDSEQIYIVLLKTKSLSHRFDESKRLLIEVIRLLYARSGRKDYAAALTRLNVESPLQQIVDLEDRNEVEDEDGTD